MINSPPLIFMKLQPDQMMGQGWQNRLVAVSTRLLIGHLRVISLASYANWSQNLSDLLIISILPSYLVCSHELSISGNAGKQWKARASHKE